MQIHFFLGSTDLYTYFPLISSKRRFNLQDYKDMTKKLS